MQASNDSNESTPEQATRPRSNSRPSFHSRDSVWEHKPDYHPSHKSPYAVSAGAACG